MVATNAPLDDTVVPPEGDLVEAPADSTAVGASAETSEKDPAADDVPIHEPSNEPTDPNSNNPEPTAETLTAQDRTDDVTPGKNYSNTRFKEEEGFCMRVSDEAFPKYGLTSESQGPTGAECI